jgi:hypothetical protein
VLKVLLCCSSLAAANDLLLLLVVGRLGDGHVGPSHVVNLLARRRDREAGCLGSNRVIRGRLVVLEDGANKVEEALSLDELKLSA